MLLFMILALVLPLLFLDWFRILREIPLSVLWRTELFFLIGVEIAYGVTLISSVLGVSVLSIVCLAGRRRGRTPRRAGRWLLCAASLLVALIVGEAVVLVRQKRRSRMPVLPEAADALAPHASAAWRLPPPGEPALLREHFNDPAGSREIDLVVLGESSAEGVPFQRWLSIGAIVKWQLEEAIKGLSVRLTTLAPRVTPSNISTRHWRGSSDGRRS